MPRYRFHIHNDLEVEDHEGTELSDLDAARRFAVRNARELICDSVREGHIDLRHHIEVADEAGARLFILTFGEAISIRG